MKKKNKRKVDETLSPKPRNIIRTLLKVGAVLLIVVICVIVAALSYFKYWDMKNKQTEKVIDQKFHQEISQLPAMQVNSFLLWEGDSFVTATVANKGEVRFWYGLKGVPSIDQISGINTAFQCNFVESDGSKTAYAYDLGLVLDKDSAFKKWFPFEVNNLSDLVKHYDDIVAILKMFPKNPKMIPLEDPLSQRQVVATSDPDFVVKQTYNGKELWCDLIR